MDFASFFVLAAAIKQRWTSFPRTPCGQQGWGGLRKGEGGRGAGGHKPKFNLPFHLSKQSNHSGSYAGSSKTSLSWLTAGFDEWECGSCLRGPITGYVGGTPVQQGIGGGGVPGSHLGCADWLFSEKNWQLFFLKNSFYTESLKIYRSLTTEERNRNSEKIQVNWLQSQMWWINVSFPPFLSCLLSSFQIVSPTSNIAAGGKLQLRTQLISRAFFVFLNGKLFL